MSARGRFIGMMGETFIGTDHGSAAVVGGQPVMVRMQGVPTMPGYRDRPSKWNFARLSDRLRRLLRSPIGSGA
jgi:hypothetical protein